MNQEVGTIKQTYVRVTIISSVPEGQVKVATLLLQKCTSKQ